MSQRKHSWSLLRRIGENRSLPWCIVGDFNELLHLSETTSTAGWRLNQIQHFRSAVDDLSLSEILMEQSHFTWWNKRVGDSSVRSKLDRGLGNGAFKQLQPNCSLHTMPMVTSDHHLLKLELQPSRSSALRHPPSRMEPWWFSFPECQSLIESAWSTSMNSQPGALLEALQRIKHNLISWSRRTFG